MYMHTTTARMKTSSSSSSSDSRGSCKRTYKQTLRSLFSSLCQPQPTTLTLTPATPSPQPRYHRLSAAFTTFINLASRRFPYRQLRRFHTLTRPAELAIALVFLEM
ncbi:unnamed protein product [Ceratitis capitata]|uniref:(Mediterranean fruit fly) hypothetical protein n=1 Tax=Ceratitis capitata TaxID=7213 RepID=A0A811V128_CERCA|nr:unnamed protein product [Ceratitis capitata]